MPAVRRASEQDKQALVERVDAFIFDCDGGQSYYIMLLSVMWLLRDAGVIWRGDSLIDGVPETLDLLRSLVRTLFYANWGTLAGCRS